MEYKQEDCRRDTQAHINQVKEFMVKAAHDILWRAVVHDQSKLQSPEIEMFTEYTPKLKNSIYGSDEYKGFLQGMGEALKHHYEHNSHHPEHFKKYVCNGCFKVFKKQRPDWCDICGYAQMQEESDITQMNLLDIIEMFCDWKAATMRHADGDIYKSIEHNKGRFGYSDDLAEIFKNTAILFDSKE